jgi:translation initiation factor RLI1
MLELLKKSILAFLCITMGACVKTPPKSPEHESLKILALLKELDSFYKEDRFYLTRVLYPQKQWTIVWIGMNTTGRYFNPTEKNIREYIQEKLAELKRKRRKIR